MRHVGGRSCTRRAMMLPARALWPAVLLSATMLLLPAPAWPQGYPSRPIKLVVPFPAGGPSDFFSRILGHGLLHYREKRVATLTVEGKQESYLGSLNDCSDAFPLMHDFCERRLGRQVVVPKIMMNQLLTPLEIAGASAAPGGPGPARWH